MALLARKLIATAILGKRVRSLPILDSKHCLSTLARPSLLTARNEQIRKVTGYIVLRRFAVLPSGKAKSVKSAVEDMRPLIRNAG